MPAEVFVGVSPRAGVGQTTLLLNLAYNCGESKKVLYVDMDVLNPGGTSLLGLEREPSLWDILIGKSNPETYLYRFENFDILPLYIYSPREMALYLDEERKFASQILDKIDELSRSYDYIFIDSLPGYTITSVMTWQKYTNLIGVGNYNVQSISSLLQIIDIFKEWSARNLKREFMAIIFNDTGNHEKIDIRVLSEIFVNIPIYQVSYTREFYASLPIAREDLIYRSELRKILRDALKVEI